MKPEIVDKLNKFLHDKVPFTEECQVVYLMVELRKLIEQEAKGHFQLVHFYCDWIVHPLKNRNNRFIAEVKSVIDEILKANTIDFLMPELRDEILSLFTAFGLQKELCLDKVVWKQFVHLLVLVLADQRIVEDKLSLSSFRYEPGNKDHIAVEITFSDKRGTRRFESGTIF